MFFTEARRISGSAETMAAMSSRERPAPESRARIASGLEAELMQEEESSSGLLYALDNSWNAFLDTSRAWVGARPQDATR
jgi:hypothetical protein